MVAWGTVEEEPVAVDESCPTALRPRKQLTTMAEQRRSSVRSNAAEISAAVSTLLVLSVWWLLL